MKKNIICILISCLVFFTIFSGCQKDNQNNIKNENNIKSDKINIVTTIFPYYDFAREVAGDKANIKLLLSPGSEPHSYDPSPSDIVAIENCDIFIYNGGESDEWVESVLSSLQNQNVKILCMFDYVELLNEKNPDHTIGDEEDEHIWTSIRNAEILINVIKDEISKIDEKNSNYYLENSRKIINQLDEIDNNIKEICNSAQNKTLVFGDRFPMIYFLNDYNLNFECAFPGCSSETEPSLKVVTHLIDFVRENEIAVVFYMDFSSGNIAKLIAEDTKAKPLRLSSCHNVTKTEFENGETYYSLMKKNYSVLKEALS